MRKYETEQYTREDSKVVIIDRCINPHWDAMPGEFDKIFLYDPVKAEELKDPQKMNAIKKRTRTYLLVGIGMVIVGIGIPLAGNIRSPWAIPFSLIALAGLVMMIVRLGYVGSKLNPYTCLKCPFPEDPGAF